ncbi:MAG TPA: hypothetical protein VFT71_08875 [Candidatus Nitrosocosmicus sp.]|nr:hypothetical protein [Candidatus Nitrosocosmicus sp.]
MGNEEKVQGRNNKTLLISNKFLLAMGGSASLASEARMCLV